MVKTNDDQYELHYQKVNRPTEPEFLLKEGANGGISVPVEAAENSDIIDTFDIVVIATPMTQDKTSIKVL